VFDVQPDRTLTNVRVFAVITPGNPDGCAWTRGPALHQRGRRRSGVLTRSTLLESSHRTAANVSFGGPNGDMLFITANTPLWHYAPA
jgi:sugar lactone lactonase YvrE